MVSTGTVPETQPDRCDSALRDGIWVLSGWQAERHFAWKKWWSDNFNWLVLPQVTSSICEIGDRWISRLKLTSYRLQFTGLFEQRSQYKPIPCNLPMTVTRKFQEVSQTEGRIMTATYVSYTG
jgi:hypothetical protein